ncbi:MAG: beta-ketoacyl synthase chain length factor [Bacteroidales bacterium]|nr:beta-ketoacyl synthase chain length factor [Bacteroidales bacterium]
MTSNRIFINGLGNVSPQKTTCPEHFLDEPVSYETNPLKCIDPGYKEFIPPEQIRRMGRIIRMGVSSAKLCLRDAGQTNIDGTLLAPDAIITGTGLGCLEDTEKFLASMINNKEEFLTPTSFIQSTHNTVAGQIALLLKCHGYNFTYVHRAFSFEDALIDAMTQLQTGTFGNVLAGGSDEITAHSFAIMGRMGFWKRKPVNSLRLYQDKQRGTIAGEGSAFFFLGNQQNIHTRAELHGVDTILNPGSMDEVIEKCMKFLSCHGLKPADIDLVVPGMNGDPCSDQVYHDIFRALFPNTPLACFKHLCGEYNTASAFALWMAAMMIVKRQVPPICLYQGGPPANLKNILIYNHFRNLEHAFILVSQV